jgi:thiol-disulfide isomerase/thioredoxin
MRISFFLFLVLLLFTEFTFAKKETKYGTWQGKLALSSSVDLPFRMIITKGKGQPNILIKNDEEIIHLIFASQHNDTLVYDFPQFDSRLNLVFNSDKSFTGNWWNKNKKGMYTIPLSGHFCTNDLFECQKGTENVPMELAKKWKTNFSYNTEDAWPAIGLFDKNKEKLTGTFLTETGDYRYLEGNMYNNKLFLSCFDGSHAFLFTADLNQDTLKGTFYSGTHYSCDWQATPDADFQLPDPNELTFVVNENPLKFKFNTLEGKEFSYPNEAFKNKVTIIQIMGSWCPNCMDETHYFKELYAKYHDKGLEIILVGYEAGSDESEYTNKLKRFQERNQLPFTMLVGGAANKNKAASDFSMLNHIISFPTSIFVDKAGNIVNVHTGFNGPGTGQYYTDYILETEKLVQELLGH